LPLSVLVSVTSDIGDEGILTCILVSHPILMFHLLLLPGLFPLSFFFPSTVSDLWSLIWQVMSQSKSSAQHHFPTSLSQSILALLLISGFVSQERAWSHDPVSSSSQGLLPFLIVSLCIHSVLWVRKKECKSCDASQARRIILDRKNICCVFNYHSRAQGLEVKSAGVKGGR